MRNPIVRSVLFVTAIFLASLSLACGAGDRLDAKTEEYQVVTEGSANGVTDAVGPAPSTPPMTGTSADTTTAFTVIAPNAGTDPGAIPPPPVYSAPPPVYSPPPSRPTPSTYEPVEPEPPRRITPRPLPPPRKTPVPPPPEPPTPTGDEEEEEDVEPEPEPPPPTQTTTDPDGR
ncbi:MAG: hypothetical protein ACYC7A_00960 [Thermoanaerobaculia bacterium]